MDDAIDEAALPALIDCFYGRVRADPMLGPVFDAAVEDWPSHLKLLAEFWSSVMLASGRYKGNPMMKHIRQGHAITPPMFDRWLALWRRTTDEMLPPAAAAAMQEKAARIAESLQLGLALHGPDGRLKPPSSRTD